MTEIIKVVKVPKQAVGLVIGKRGHTIMTIECETITRITFLPPGPDRQYIEMRECEVYGQPRNVRTAIAKITDIVAKFQSHKSNNTRPQIQQLSPELSSHELVTVTSGLAISSQANTVLREDQQRGSTASPSRLPAPAVTSPPPDTTSSAVTSHASREQEAAQCLICMSARSRMGIYDCGHVCLCEECAVTFRRSQPGASCPVCRKPVKDIIKIYL